MFGERFFGQEWSDENVDYYDVKSTHIITAQIKADDISEAKTIFRNLLATELDFSSLLPSDRIYAEDYGHGKFRCLVVTNSSERYP